MDLMVVVKPQHALGMRVLVYIRDGAVVSQRRL